jgi:tetratricopeptide (TPR) repeat protein
MIAVLCVVMLPHVVAHADDAVMRARAYYKSGQAHYDAGEYEDALHDFEAGYELSKKPQFLVNIGQAHRKLGHLEQARDNYARYLKEVTAVGPVRAEVQQVLEEIERELAGGRPAPPPPAPAPVPVSPGPSAPAIAAPAAASPGADALLVKEPARAKPSFIKKNWWIIPVTAVVLGGVAVGIYFGVRPAEQVHCGDSMVFGCINAK